MFKSKKYFELFKDDYKIINGVTVYRIKALIDFDDIKSRSTRRLHRKRGQPKGIL